MRSQHDGRAIANFAVANIMLRVSVEGINCRNLAQRGLTRRTERAPRHSRAWPRRTRRASGPAATRLSKTHRAE
jgi:hypothetical protein